jgi:uncharacterized pyridoxal phosphate-containing UPF0001 family protein
LSRRCSNRKQPNGQATRTGHDEQRRPDTTALHGSDRANRGRRSAGRAFGNEITLVAVSKTFDAADIEPVLKIPHRVFGENRVQESYGKWPELKQQYPDTRLHLIGPLQSNKTREAVELFDCIETLDREKLAKTLAKEIQAIGRSPELFIQVNTGLEPQKAGIAPDAIDGFVKDCRENS